ncbi:WAPL family protein [Aspergillus affinis]|uniref:WAPL family protein n=1 Tax=Aspergillus affinis TaxID=1070780 RepID=UPI0022FEB13F|nr:uncharacterized protein KD926_000593 [Aspergillus affinis]KAI9037386.1 hypothetical protein KD926_000593 [Aspergillus affinis]
MPAEGDNLHSSSQASAVGHYASDLEGSPGNSPGFDSDEVVNTRLQTRNRPNPLDKGNFWNHGDAPKDPSLILPRARPAPTKRETPRKRKSLAPSQNIDSESSQDPPRAPGKHQRTGWTRKRLVDSLGPSEDFTTDKYPFSALDDSQTPSHPGATLRKYHPSPEPRINRSGAMSFAELTRQPPSTSSMLRGSRVTYARQRSFLDDNPLLDSLTGGKSVTSSGSHDLSPSRPSALHTQLLHSVDDDENEKGDSKPVRSIHELRQAGEKARFCETVELILEDIEGSSNSLSERCDGYSRLCLNLLEPRFVRQFCECGFEERIVESTTEGLDMIPASLALCAYSLIFNSGSFSFVLSGRFWWKIMQIAPQLLVFDVSFTCLVDQQSTTSTAKPVRHSLRKNLQQILSAVCGDQSSNTSPRFLALYVINTFLHNLRQKVRSVEPISTSLLDQLVGLLMTNKPGKQSATQFELFSSVLSILDSSTVLSSGPWSHSQCNSFGLLSRLCWLFYPNQLDQNRRVLGLYIRVIMNITNTNSSLCKALATPELVAGLVGIVAEEFCHVPDDSPAKENSSLDIVILALGALTNVAEKSQSSRALFLMSARNSTSFFQLLLQQFSHGINSIGKAHSVSEVHKNVAIGYLSILLATLCLNEEILSQAETMLDKGLALILSTAEEFLQYHQKVEQDSYPMESRDDGGAGLSTRLEHIISSLRQHDAYHQ